MLNVDDPATFLSVRELRCSVKQSTKPLVLWIGAGASRWLEYRLWKDAALNLRRGYFKYVGGFDNDKTLRWIQANSLSSFFQLCRDLDRSRYCKFPSTIFLPRPETPLSRRFTDALKQISPLHILTTNIGECLEQRFPHAAVFSDRTSASVSSNGKLEDRL